jgi:hypothetical protein
MGKETPIIRRSLLVYASLAALVMSRAQSHGKTAKRTQLYRSLRSMSRDQSSHLKVLQVTVESA